MMRPWMKFVVAIALVLGLAKDAHVTAIHSIFVQLEELVESSDVIAIVAPIAQSASAPHGSREFALVKLLYVADAKAKIPPRFAVGPSHRGTAFVTPPRPDPSGKEESPIAYRYSTSLKETELAREKQIIVFLNATQRDTQPYCFAVDEAFESVTRLADVQALIRRAARRIPK